MTITTHDLHRVRVYNAIETGCWWALWVHPVLFALVYVLGFTFGADPVFGVAVPLVYGHEGGMSGMGILLFLYLATLGRLPVMISIIAFFLGASCRLIFEIWYAKYDS